jgi:UvrD/REP helicase N-terminal domain
VTATRDQQPPASGIGDTTTPPAEAGGDDAASEMGEAAAEIAAEQRYVDRVYARLERAKKDAAEAEAAGYRLANVGNFGALVERDAMVFHAARRRRMLDAEHEGLVFGRLDLHGPETRYVGRLGLRDDEARALVIDWRAPAAAPFYRATATDPMKVIRRRTIASNGERVTSIEDDLLDPDAAPTDMRVIGDGALVASLARTTGTGMRDIVATIQREQDEAIRSPASGVTFVRGGPGTGKTAVALHRAAYLLYSDRQRFAGGGVLVVGPSPIFVTYISRVLPSLGEDEVTLSSLGSMVDGIVASRHDASAVATVKGSARMARLLARAARGTAPDAPTDLRVLYRGTLLRLGRRELDRLRETVFGLGSSRNGLRRKAAGYVLDALWQQARDLLGPGWTTPREDFAEQVAERREFIVFMRGFWPVLRPIDVLGWLADPDRLRSYANGLLDRREMALLAGALPAADAKPATAQNSRGAKPAGVSVEDVALLDELDDLLGQPPRPPRQQGDPYMVGGVREVTTYADRQAAARRTFDRPTDYRDYAHVVVDEAQDVSPMQWRMIGRRAAYASWTIVGDPAQSAWQGDPTETRKARDAALRGRKHNDYVLHTNYRNSVEIFDVAATVVRHAEPDLELPTAVRRTGVEPTHVVAERDEFPSSVRAEMADLLAGVAGTVGVIAAQSNRDLVASWIGPDIDARVQVVTSLEAKGMEYDGVLVVDPAAIVAESASGVRTLYVALSRATQRLTTVATDDLWLQGKS